MKRGPRVGRLADTPEADRPREKLLHRGAAALSDEELLALVLGTGTAGRPVLETARQLLDGGLSALFRRGEAELLANARGVGPAKAARVAAVLEIARRLQRESLSARVAIGDAAAAARYLVTALAHESREVMGGLLLDAKNRLLKDAVVFQGTATHASVAPAPLFRQAILAGATGLVLYHNHPSGDPSPSAEDDETTQRFQAAGREIGIEVKDHLVVGAGACYSFHRRAMLSVA
jgi:DNA repair protein RadC